MRKKMYLERLVLLVLLMTLIMFAASVCGGKSVRAAQLPSPQSVLGDYMNNPYIRFYEGNEGIAWTTIHPGGYALTANGAYIYAGGQSIYRGIEGTEVIPSGVISRKELNGELQPGHHYYAQPIENSVIPVGRWVLMHRDAECVHGPFAACRDHEYYGVSGLSNHMCGEDYDSGWIAYCADCGRPLTGYVYTSADCVSRIGYIFAGSGEFSFRYPVDYMFICPVDGDNLENDVALRRHECECFISCNRYNVVYDGNGADIGEMDASVFYYGGESIYEGHEVEREEALRKNEFINPGFIFSGWSESPDGPVLFSDMEDVSEIEDHFVRLGDSGEGSDDQVITLYACWTRCDSVLCISGGSFNGNAGSYHGVENGESVSELNSFERGYHYETFVDPFLLDAPFGYKVTLNAMEGSSADAVYSECELSGWIFESDDPGGRNVLVSDPHGFEVTGSLSGEITELLSDGKLTYLHSSVIDGNIDHITALWRSTTVLLPGAYCPGMVFDGWYTDPDMSESHFAGGEGDLFMPGHDTVLYASFTGISLVAEPDYMGNEDFGEDRYSGLTRLTIPEFTGNDIFRYFISPDVYPMVFEEAVCETGITPSNDTAVTYSSPREYTSFQVSRTGIYSFELWGARGASYDRYSGEDGEYSECSFFLNEGDTVEIYTGAAGNVTSSSGSVTCGGGEGSYISINGNVVMSSSGGKGASFTLNVSRTFNYTGSMQTFTASAEGDYTLKVWGASGKAGVEGGAAAGRGGYAAGTVHLQAGSVLYICVGGTNGYNGGGSGGSSMYGARGGNGGGATHIASVSGQLSTLSGKKDKVYIVAGGGGGAAGANSTAGAGGGNSGGNGISPWPGGEATARGGTQTSPGTGSSSGRGRGGFGYGGNGYSYNEETGDFGFIMNGGGGGGWYGGGGGAADTDSYGCGGAGGSGYIGGVRNGSMRNGENSGNGRAVITCNISITGRDPSGRATEFMPGNILYSGHRVVTHAYCEYPADDPAGNGYCIVGFPAVRYYNSDSVICLSPDAASPDPVRSIGYELDTVSRIAEISWDMPNDNGTAYNFMARAYNSANVISGSDAYAQTNTERLLITTGIYRYYYVVDSTDVRDDQYILRYGTPVMSSWSGLSGTSRDADFVSWYESVDASDRVCHGFSFAPDGTDRYLHLVAEDRAGNLSEAVNVAIDGKHAAVPYPLRTEKLSVLLSDNVYVSPDRPDVYYVRADSQTAFSLEYSAYIDGYASDLYQIDTAYFMSSASEYAFSEAEKSDASLPESEVTITDFVRTADFMLSPVRTIEAVRTEHARVLSLTEEFAVSSEEELFIYPSASATCSGNSSVLFMGDDIVRSNPDEDVLNGITLVGDSSAPVCMVSVNGGEYVTLSECDISNVASECVIDRRNESVTVDLYVSDEGAGLKGNFTVKIVNIDNGLEGEFVSVGDHFITELKIDEDSPVPSFENMLFNGKFVIYVTAEDNVGNMSTESSEHITELDIKGKIVRCLDEISGPLFGEEGEPAIKRGESGYVMSYVWGYPDAVLVSFESAMLGTYDVLYVAGGYMPDGLENTEVTVVEIDAPGYMLELRTDFTVPLEYDGDVINVSITAFRGDERLSWTSECGVLSEGSVLDEWVTVLR